jgi:hypothetical protein
MSRLALVSALVLFMVSMGQAQTNPPTVYRPPQVVAPSKDGWWIRVDAKATTATRIDWQFGTTPKSLVARDSWRPGGPVDIHIAPPLRFGKVLYIRATTTPANASAFVCVFFQQQGVELFRFSGTEDRPLDADKRESQCTAPTIYRVGPRLYDVPPERVPRGE